LSVLSVKWRRIVGCLVLAFSLLSPFGCASRTHPSAPPTATSRLIPSDMAIYLMLTERYTSLATIMRVQEMTVDEVARILQALQAVEPPSGYEALHDQALDAYRQITAGKLLLPGSDSELRSEAYFMIDWGITRLLDYREKLEASQ
jgi:hypothetical protein